LSPHLRGSAHRVVGYPRRLHFVAWHAGAKRLVQFALARCLSARPRPPAGGKRGRIKPPCRFAGACCRARRVCPTAWVVGWGRAIMCCWVIQSCRWVGHLVLTNAAVTCRLASRQSQQCADSDQRFGEAREEVRQLSEAHSLPSCATLLITVKWGREWGRERRQLEHEP